MTTLTTAGLKICGVTRIEDLRACASAGVDAIGLNLWSGSKRALTVDDAIALVAAWPETPAPMRRVGVFVDHAPSEVDAITGTLRLDAVQLHGDRPPDEYESVRAPIVWVIRGTPDLETLLRLRPRRPPQWVLLDAAVPGFGGAGAQTDWEWAARARAALKPWPVWLAGGLRPDNALRALDIVHPAGLDVASGAELAGAERGEKDADAIAALVAICHNRGRGQP